MWGLDRKTLLATFFLLVVLPIICWAVFPRRQSVLLAYAARTSEAFQIFTVNVDCESGDTLGSPKQVTDLYYSSEYNLNWSPNGKYLAFDTNSDYMHPGLVVLMVGPTNDLTIEFGAIRGANLVWSADSQWIAFTVNDQFLNNELHIFNLITNKEYRITKTLDQNLGLAGKRVFLSSNAWSRDNLQLVFRDGLDDPANPIKRSEIYTADVSDPEHPDLRRLSDNTVEDSDPKWSDDGSSILFVSNRDGSAKTYSMNLDGSNVQVHATLPNQPPRPSYITSNGKFFAVLNNDVDIQIWPTTNLLVQEQTATNMWSQIAFQPGC